MQFLDYALPFLLLLVLGILVAGVITMARPGHASRVASNKLMQARIATQLLVVIVVALMLFFGH